MSSLLGCTSERWQHHGWNFSRGTPGQSSGLEWDVGRKGLGVVVVLERKHVSHLNTARHLKQPIDLLFRIHAGRLPVIKHSAAKINKWCGALNLAASKSYLKTTKKISLLLKCHQGTSSVWTQLSNFNDKSLLPVFPSGSPAGRWQELDSAMWQGIYFLPLSVYKGGSTGKINLDNIKHLLR